MTDKISLIIPVYNASKTLRRCLDSVIKQSYKNVEVIVINDGSTDDSEKIIQAYQRLFENAGMTMIYKYQRNQGLGGAINAGLKMIHGDFLCWIDPDDFLFPDSFEKRLSVIRNNPELGVVSSDAYVFKDPEIRNPIGKVSDGKDLSSPYQFENHLLGKAIFCAGCHMVRMSYFDKAVPDREIYSARRGQNWQLLLPIYYSYKQYFLNEPLYAYILYDDSMSRGDATRDQLYSRYEEHRTIVHETIDRINMSEDKKRFYKKMYNKKYYREMYYESIAFHDYPNIIKHLLNMIASGEWNRNDTKWHCEVIKRRLCQLFQ